MGTGNNIMIVWLDYEDGDSYVKEAAVAQAGGEAKYISAAQVKSAISGDWRHQRRLYGKRSARAGGADQFRQPACQNDRNLLQRRRADYGIGAFNKTATAGIVGVALVMVFMLVVYRFAA